MKLEGLKEGLMNFAPHILVESKSFGTRICRYCGLSEEYLEKGSLGGGWPYGGRWQTREGEWAMVCKYWPAFADKSDLVEKQLQYQSGYDWTKEV